MTKSELQTGMVVTCRNGKEYIVFIHVNLYSTGTNDYLINKYEYNYLSDYTDELFIKEEVGGDFKNNDYDIMKVEQPNHPSSILNHNTNDRILLWEREDEKVKQEIIKLTTSEVLNILNEKYGDNIIFQIDSTLTLIKGGN